MKTLISVCICTYRRRSLERTLQSLSGQRLPKGTSVEIIVVDNDRSGSGREVVEGMAAFPFPIRYDIETRKGLSFVRNRALELAKGDWLAFIDDDEVAASDWLFELFECAQKFQADAVVGAVSREFEEPPLPWIANSGLFNLWIPPTGSSVRAYDAQSGNVLLRADFPRTNELKFDETFNATGGEDTDFFGRLIDNGGVIVSSRQASVCEFVPRQRMTEHYMFRSSLSIGEVFARINHQRGGAFAAVACITRATINIAGASLLAIACIPWGKRFYYRYYLALVRNVGKFRYFLGFRPIVMYFDEQSEAHQEIRGHNARAES